MDTEYILDCAAELGEVTPLELAILYSTEGCYPALRAIVDDNLLLPKDGLANLTANWLDTASASQKSLMVIRCLPGLEEGISRLESRLAEIVRTVALEDSGLDTPSLHHLFPELDLDTTARPKLLSSLSELSEDKTSDILTHVCGGLIDRWRRDFEEIQKVVLSHSFTGALNNWSTQLANQNRLDASPVITSAIRAHIEKSQAATQRNLRAKAIGAIKKATKLFSRLGQSDSLAKFVSGHEVELSHPDSSLKFVVKPLSSKGWLFDRTVDLRRHTPYHLIVLSKTDVVISSLCVYFKDAPVLDQLLSLTLLIQAGEEDQLLKTANWFGCASRSSPEVAALIQERPFVNEKLPTKLSESSEGSLNLLDAIAPAARALEKEWQPYEQPVKQWILTALRPLSNKVKPLKPLALEVVRTLESQPQPFLPLPDNLVLTD